MRHELVTRMRLVLAVVVSLPALVFAKPAGITFSWGMTPATNCASCHTGAAAKPTVTVTGPMSLAAGASGTYSVAVTGGPAMMAGVNAALNTMAGATAPGVTFTAGTGTKVLDGEIVQTAPLAFSAGTATFGFSMKAPTAAGSYTLNVAALSADGDGLVTNDGTGAAMVTVTVTGGTTMMPVDAGTQMPVDAGSGGGGGSTGGGAVVTPTPSTPYVPKVGPYDGVGGIEAGCSAGVGAPALLLALGALLRRRRTR